MRVDPRYARSRQPEDAALPCRRLASAVLTCAIEDLQAPNEIVRTRARLFLLKDNPGLTWWCSLAGVDVGTLRRQLIKHTENR